MMTQYKKMNVISNNIANSDTTSFKKDGVVTESFGEVLMMRINDPEDPAPKAVGTMGMSVKVDNVFTNFGQGSLVKTNNSYDIALSGKGFISIQVEKADGSTVTRYTRDGQLNVTADGYLVTKEGQRVLGQQGVIQVPPATKELTINKQGEVIADEVTVDTLNIVDVKDKTTLRKIGQNLYASTEGTELEGFKGQVIQGYIEGSNVDTVREMVEMINVSRAYEASQKMLKANDESLGKAVNDVGDL